MKEIKTRETIKSIRVPDRAATIARRTENTYVRTKEQADQTPQSDDNSPIRYAEGVSADSIRNLTRDAGYKLQTAKSLILNYTERGRNFAQNSQRRVERSASNVIGGRLRLNSKAAGRSAEQHALISEKATRLGVKGSIKTAERSIKTPEHCSHKSIATTQPTAKIPIKSVQAARATQTTIFASIKRGVRAISTAAKAAIGAIKGLITSITAGALAAVMVIVIVLLSAAILGSIFGLFASEERYAEAPSMPEVVSQLNAEFFSALDKIISTIPHDRLVIDDVGIAPMVANWNQVLAVYAVLIATDPEIPAEVATLDDVKINKLKTVFWNMNSINYSVEKVVAGTDEETGTPVTETILTITVSSKTAESMISLYGFTSERVAQLHELLQPEYTELFQRLTGSYQNITLSASQIAAIMETLPKDLSRERREVVLTAYSLLGKVTYFWGGKSLVLGWDNRWGTPMKVTADGSSTTGTVRPFGMDCSGFVDWVLYNAYDGAYILGRGGGTSSQYSYCDVIAWSSAQPGDLVFYPNCEHVGIVVESNADTLTVIHCTSGYNNVVMTQHTRGNGFSFVGRPQIYEK